MCTETITAVGQTAGSFMSAAAPYASLFARGAQAAGQVQQGAERAALFEYRAQRLNEQAVRDLQEGAIAEQIARERGADVIGAQRARYGASGVQVGSGSGLAVLADTVAELERDALNIRYRYSRQSIARREQAAYELMEARSARRGGYAAAGGSILGALGSESFARLMRPAEEPQGSTTPSGASAPEPSSSGSFFDSYRW